MAVLVVRHADAGDRDAWSDADGVRPLNRRGRAQAEGLIGVLAGFSITGILSSPSLRCTETVAPLALARGLRVVTSDDLAEGSGDVALRLIEETATRPSDTVLCTHGDVLSEVLDALARGGVALPGAAPAAKGSTWVLGAEGGRVVDARYLGPP